MSNTSVGPIYKRVIDAVIEASRNDFEESGVSTVVLESMREKWQNRLTSSERALFPWDPQPEPPQALKSERIDRGDGVSSPYTNGHTNGVDAPQIKQENYDASFLNLPARGPNQGMNPQYASQRAAQLMHQQFGSQANDSITALRQSQQQQQQQQGQQRQTQSSPSVPPNFPTYPQQTPYGATQNGHQLKAEDGPRAIKQEAPDQKSNSLELAQVDGAEDPVDEDGDAIVFSRNGQGRHEPMGHVAVDRSMRNMIERSAQRLEGGGLMVPLNERLPSQRRDRRTERAQGPASELPSARSSSTVTRVQSPPRLPLGGGDMADDDDDDDDADAINSELDDPDETADTTQEGVYEGDVVLCLYDKVQRVKNKWKCVLRDGILTIDGKDYIFHKMTGEFEW